MRLPALALALLMTTAAMAATNALDFKMNTLDGKPVDLAKAYEGQVVLVVNVASKCGYTYQYSGLQELYERHKDDGLVVLGVPCNQFGGQEPGTATEIAQFCDANYGVTFPMLEKVDVNGPDTAPLYEHLKSEADPSGDIRWNFEKFLIGRDGQVKARYGSGTEPDDDKLLAAIKEELAKK